MREGWSAEEGRRDVEDSDRGWWGYEYEVSKSGAVSFINLLLNSALIQISDLGRLDGRGKAK